MKGEGRECCKRDTPNSSQGAGGDSLLFEPGDGNLNG